MSRKGGSASFIPSLAEIVTGMKDEFETAAARFRRADQRLVRPPVCVGRDVDEELARSAGVEHIKLDPHGLGGSAPRDVENVGGQAGQSALHHE